jgi:bacterioferritin (cytochrome b1)
VVTRQADVAARTRRAFLGSSTAAGALLVLGGCGETAPHQTTVPTIPPRLGDADIAVLNELLGHEYKAIAAYTAGAPLLDGTAHDAAKQFLTHELYHASKLYSMIKSAGGMPDKPKTNYQLGRPRSHEDVLRLLHAVEHVQVAAYLAAIPTISLGTARGVLSAILANDAQHVAIVRSELGLDPLTGALVRGVE